MFFHAHDNQTGIGALLEAGIHQFREVDVRWLAIAAIAALSSLGVNAAEPVAVEASAAAEVVVALAPQEPVVTPIPMPAQVTVLIEDLNTGSKLKPARKLKVAKPQTLPKSMLSRTERHQMAILAAAPKAESGFLRELFDDEDGGSGAEDIDLHRSFSRPQVAKALDADADDEALAVTPETSIRLLLARMKAVEARVLAEAADQMNDELLSDAVMRRLHLARTRAVEAHQKKFT